MSIEPENWLKLATGAIAAAASWLGTSWSMAPPIVQLLLGMMVADIVTGVLAGKRIHGGLSSDKAYVGMRKKGIALVIVAMVGYAKVLGQVEVPLVEFTAGFFIGHEGLSILENAALAGLPVPSVLKDWLEKLGQKPRTKPALRVN